MAKDDDQTTADEWITYFGVPLAVLGVLPILYNTFATLVAVSKVRRALRHSKLDALTRTDVVNRVIEIELPRLAVRPLDRFQHRGEYWSTSHTPSSIPGGSWTTFNWSTNTIGLKTIRIVYADQLRQPQVDADFAELVAYLLDLGAVPDPHGWRLLRSTGLWTPVGCALMLSPDGHEKALTIAPLNDSDGHLSLKVYWSPEWTTRDYSHLPPYWVRIPAPPVLKAAEEPASEDALAPDLEKAGSEAKVEEEMKAADELGPSELEPKETEGGEAPSLHKDSLDSSPRQAGKSNSTKSITCQISADGLITALTEESQLHSSLDLDSVYIEHLRTRPSPSASGAAPSLTSAGTWFASAATAFGTTGQTVLWSYKIPDALVAFARRETVPCGVLVLLGVVDESATPEWATRHGNDHGAALDRFAQRHRDSQRAMQAEAMMPPAQREAAARDRMRRENEMRMQDMRDKMREDAQRREARQMEALQSPKWDTRLVAEHNLTWLRKRADSGVYESLTGVKEAAGALLHRMIVDTEFSTKVCALLDRWRAWGELGGMKRDDFTALRDDPVLFAEASLLLAVIRDATGALEGSLSMDLQECLRLWRTVRLG